VTLRRKAIAIISVTMLALGIGLASILGFLTMRAYSRLEREDAVRKVERAAKSLGEVAEQLGTIAGDWAPWDATYAFMAGRNPGYADDNLAEPSLANLKLNVVAFFDRRGALRYARAFDLASGKIVPMPADFESLVSRGELLRHSGQADGVEGLIRLSDGRLMLAAGRPITTSDYSAPVSGTLVMGRFLDEAELRDLSARTSLELSAAAADIGSLPPDFAAALPRLLGQGVSFARPLDAERVAGYALLRDPSGEPTALLRAEIPRRIYRQGRIDLGYILLAVGLSTLVSSALIFFVIDRLLLGRVSRLGAEISRIGESRDFGARVRVEGEDELSSLASTLNATLSELEASMTEKEMLIREIHHRVKNNLQVVSSLLSLQSGSQGAEGARQALKESQARIHSMALIHELLYCGSGPSSTYVAGVEFLEYLRRLTAFLQSANDTDQSRIRIEVSGDEIYLDADEAVACGLLANELISNSLKHAFPGGGPGRIAVSLRSGADGSATLDVSDDGAGFPPGFALSSSGSMGWQLIRALCRQIDGEIELGGGGGASVSVAFRRREVPMPKRSG
jgi:two-component sensor histidine kinase